MPTGAGLPSTLFCHAEIDGGPKRSCVGTPPGATGAAAAAKFVLP